MNKAGGEAWMKQKGESRGGRRGGDSTKESYRERKG